MFFIEEFEKQLSQNWISIHRILALLLSAVSGLGYHGPLRIGGLTMPALHAALAAPLALFIVVHLVAVFLHDLRGGNALVSAMIGGERIVRIERPDAPGGPVRVSLDALQVGQRRNRD